MNNNNHVRILYAVIALLIIALGFQQWRYREILNKVTLYSATITAVDTNTGNILRPTVASLPSKTKPAPSYIQFTASKVDLKWECIHIEPQTISVSATGYSTQSYVIATAHTNIEARLTALQE
jgi:hypothetical protein